MDVDSVERRVMCRGRSSPDTSQIVNQRGGKIYGRWTAYQADGAKKVNGHAAATRKVGRQSAGEP